MSLSPLLIFGVIGTLAGIAIFAVGSLLVNASEPDRRKATPVSNAEYDAYDAGVPIPVPAAPIDPRLAQAMATISGVAPPQEPPETAAAAAAAPTWTHDLTGDDAPVDSDVRVDMIERLAMVGLPWCGAILERAASEETDAMVLDAAERALLVVRARPTLPA